MYYIHMHFRFLCLRSSENSILLTFFLKISFNSGIILYVVDISVATVCKTVLHYLFSRAQEWYRFHAAQCIVPVCAFPLRRHAVWPTSAWKIGS